MDANLAISRDDDANELDLHAYPAEPSPSLLEVATAGVARSLPIVRRMPFPETLVLSPMSLAAIGLTVGAGLGLILI